jgi:hypothetical protein
MSASTWMSAPSSTPDAWGKDIVRLHGSQYAIGVALALWKHG